MLQLLLVAFLFLFFISFHRFLLFVLAGLGALLQLDGYFYLFNGGTLYIVN